MLVYISNITHTPTFAELVQCSLTVDHIVVVMEKVTTDEKRRSIWSDCFELDEELYEIDKEHTTEMEKTTALVGVCIYNDKFSWKHLAEFLYIKDEMAAAKEARSFLEKNGEYMYILNI